MSEIKQLRPKTSTDVSIADSTDRRVRRTRRQILEATIELMKKRGLDGFTMDAIADAADVSRSTLYRHWPQLHDLLFDAIQHLGEQLDAASTAPDGGGTTEECVVSTALMLGRFLRDDTWRTLVTSLGVAAEHNADAAAIYDRSSQKCRGSVVDFVRRGQADGALPKAVDAEWATDLLIAPIYMNAIVLHRPMSDEQIVAHVNDTFTAIAGAG